MNGRKIFRRVNARIVCAIAVMRQGKTEPPFMGRDLEHRQQGNYRYGQCNCILFTYQQKFHSGRSWPSFLEGSSGVLIRNDERVRMPARQFAPNATGIWATQPENVQMPTSIEPQSHDARGTAPQRAGTSRS